MGSQDNDHAGDHGFDDPLMRPGVTEPNRVGNMSNRRWPSRPARRRGAGKKPPFQLRASSRSSAPEHPLVAAPTSRRGEVALPPRNCLPAG